MIMLRLKRILNKKTVRKIFKNIYVSFLLAVSDTALAIKKKANKEEKSLLIVKIDGIGDYVLFRNFLKEIKSSEKYRGYKLVLAGNEAVRSLGEWLDGDIVDEFIWVNRTALHRYPLRLLDFIFNWQRSFAVAIQPTYSRSFVGDLIIRLSQAEERIGFQGDCSNISAKEKKTTDEWYTKLVAIDPKHIFEFEKDKEFFEQIIGRPILLERPIIEKDKIKSLVLPSEWQLPKDYAVIFPGAGQAFRRWPVEKFAGLADHIFKVYGLKIVIAGEAKDKWIGKKISALMADKEVIDLLGQTDLKQLAGLLAGANLLVTNDTSAAHIGPAVGIKTLVLSQFNHYARFHPYPEATSQDLICLTPDSYSGLGREELIQRFASGSNVDINLITLEAAEAAANKLLQD